VFAGDELIAFAASRAHHADVGGPTPGSMPADSRTLDDEGVVISPRVLDDARSRAQRADAPARQRRADLRAQLAAGRAGARRLTELHDRAGSAPTPARGLRRRARLRRAAHPRLPPRARRRERTAEDVLEAREGDLEIVLRATIAARS
jgi:N-methylhydantoinase B